MLPGDTICRSAVHPKYKSGDIFDEVYLLNFQQVVKKKYPYVTSVTSFKIAGSLDAVHEAGRSIANISNQREQQKLSLKSDYIPKNFQYLGYYNLPTSEINKLTSDYHLALVCWAPEDALDSHFHIELMIRDDINIERVTLADLKSDKNAIISLIADYLAGPIYCPLAHGDENLRKLQIDSLQRKEGKSTVITLNVLD